MTKYMCIHTVPPHAFTKDQVCGLADALQHDPQVRGYCSFLNLSQGKILCVLEAPDARTIANWFKKMNVPVDSITEVEYEGDHGTILDATPHALEV